MTADLENDIEHQLTCLIGRLVAIQGANHINLGPEIEWVRRIRAIENTCHWTEVQEGFWDPSCQNWTWQGDGPETDCMNYCLNCGGKIIQNAP